MSVRDAEIAAPPAPCLVTALALMIAACTGWRQRQRKQPSMDPLPTRWAGTVSGLTGSGLILQDNVGKRPRRRHRRPLYIHDPRLASGNTYKRIGPDAAEFSDADLHAQQCHGQRSPIPMWTAVTIVCTTKATPRGRDRRHGDGSGRYRLGPAKTTAATTYRSAPTGASASPRCWQAATPTRSPC